MKEIKYINSLRFRSTQYKFCSSLPHSFPNIAW